MTLAAATRSDTRMARSNAPAGKAGAFEISFQTSLLVRENLSLQKLARAVKQTQKYVFSES